MTQWYHHKVPDYSIEWNHQYCNGSDEVGPIRTLFSSALQDAIESGVKVELYGEKRYRMAGGANRIRVVHSSWPMNTRMPYIEEDENA
jgi:hypothetical protein